jgi:hypothetical protein
MKQIKKLARITIIALVVASGSVSLHPVNAAGLANPTATTTPQTVSTASTLSVIFRAVTTTAVDDKVSISLPDDYTVKAGALTLTTDYLIYYDAANPPTTNHTALTSAVGSNTNGSKGVVITLDGTNAIATTNYVRVVLNTTTVTSNPATQGFYQVVIKTLDVSSSDATLDQGAAVVSVGDEEDVTVTAEVNPSLAFAIRNTADTAELTSNLCALGTLTTTAVSTCAYRLKVSTNADDGYTVTITSDGALNTATADIDAIAEEGTVTLGTEGYGILFAGGASSEGGVSITESGDFSDDDTPIPTSATTLYTSDGPNAPSAPDTTNTALVTHRAAIDAATPSGTYDQVVTYAVTADF